jgi:L-ascorbate metabolism protein UlaG (beta-lactamase superfamily)
MRTPTLLTKLHRLNHDSFRLDGPPVIYIDPWKLPDESIQADIILVTHDHFDHCSPDDVKRLSHEDTVVICDPSSERKLDRPRVLRAGESTQVGDVKITAVPAYNINKFRSPGQPFHPREAEGNGYIISVNGEQLYHAGDTDHIPEMTMIKCDVALLPVSGTYVMTADEAFEAAKTIDAQLFVPMHYGDIVGGQGDVEKFRYLCEEIGLEVAILPGEAEHDLQEEESGQ